MAEIFERAWGNYTSLINFLLRVDPQTLETHHGVFQPFDLASLLSYSKGKNNYNNFLLENASNFVAPTRVTNDQHPDKVSAYPIKLEAAYSRFLNEFNDYLLKNLDPARLPERNTLDQQLEKAQQKLVDFIGSLDDTWRSYADANHIPQDQRDDQRIIWERDRGYSMQLDRYKHDVTAANLRINAFIKQNTPVDLWPLVDAVAYFDDPNYQVDLPVNAVFDDITRRSYWRKFRMAFPIMDLDEFLSNDGPVKNTFDTIAQDYSKVEKKWNAKASFKWGFFSGGGNVERRTCEELTKNSEFSFEISFKRFQNIEIFRDKWFQDVLFTTIGKELKSYWGPNGLLAAIPYSLVMARGTTIKVKMSQDFREAMANYISTGGSFGWGPFSASGGYTSDENTMTFRKTDEGFELTDNAQTIRMLGACVKRFNWDTAEVEKYNTLSADKIVKAHAAFMALNRSGNE